MRERLEREREGLREICLGRVVGIEGVRDPR